MPLISGKMHSVLQHIGLCLASMAKISARLLKTGLMLKHGYKLYRPYDITDMLFERNKLKYFIKKATQKPSPQRLAAAKADTKKNSRINIHYLLTK